MKYPECVDNVNNNALYLSTRTKGKVFFVYLYLTKARFCGRKVLRSMNLFRPQTSDPLINLLNTWPILFPWQAVVVLLAIHLLSGLLISVAQRAER